MKTHKKDAGSLMADQQQNQQVVFGTTNAFFIDILIKLAKANPDKEYYIPYSPSGNLHSDRNINQLAQLYAQFEYPDNILFHEDFAQMIQIYKQAPHN